MATKRLTIDGYGQLELNQVAFRRDGRIEAQCALSSTAFASKPCENGMLLGVDDAKREVTFSTDGKLPVALVYTTEHMYDERANALKDFKLELADGFYPRLGYLAKGDKFTTNCVSYDTTAYTNESAAMSALDKLDSVAVYGGVASDGTIALVSTEPTIGPVLKATKKTTMPDGQLGIKFQVVAE